MRMGVYPISTLLLRCMKLLRTSSLSLVVLGARESVLSTVRSH
jgi:hypothetical protein